MCHGRAWRENPPKGNIKVLLPLWVSCAEMENPRIISKGEIKMKTLYRFLTLLLVSSFFMVGCDTSQRQERINTELQTKIAQLEKKVESLSEKITSLEIKNEELETKFEKLETNPGDSDFGINVTPHERSPGFELNITPAARPGTNDLPHHTGPKILSKGDTVPFTASNLGEMTSTMVRIHVDRSQTNNYKKNIITFPKDSFLVLNDGTLYESAKGCKIVDSIITSGSISVSKE